MRVAHTEEKNFARIHPIHVLNMNNFTRIITVHSLEKVSYSNKRTFKKGHAALDNES